MKEEFFTGIADMWLYNFDRYRATQDKNWFRLSYTGREKKIDDEILKPIEDKINEEYYAKTNDRSFQVMIANIAKMEYLKMKYYTIFKITERMWMGFGADLASQEKRHGYIKLLKKYRFHMEIIATENEDKIQLNLINAQLQNIKTEINILKAELETTGAKETFSLNKQLAIVGISLGFNYKINPKEITVLDWIEYGELMAEKAQNN